MTLYSPDFVLDTCSKVPDVDGDYLGCVSDKRAPAHYCSGWWDNKTQMVFFRRVSLPADADRWPVGTCHYLGFRRASDAVGTPIWVELSGEALVKPLLFLLDASKCEYAPKPQPKVKK